MNENVSNLSELSDKQILSNVRIAAPCAVPWETMEGDERIRFCNQCQLNVFNISAMSEKEAVSTIRTASGGRLCLRFYRRQDGTILTENCPVGLRRIRNMIRICAAASIAFLVSFGLISEADAQGLVGAPVDPLIGQYNGVGPPPNASVEPDPNVGSLVLQGTMGVALLVFVRFMATSLRQMQYKLSQGGLFMLAFAVALGAIFGFIHF